MVQMPRTTPDKEALALVQEQQEEYQMDVDADGFQTINQKQKVHQKPRPLLEHKKETKALRSGRHVYHP